jgi:peptide chain release factor 2
MLIMLITPGAGGKESEDFASMLSYMYAMFFDKNKINYTRVFPSGKDKKPQPNMIISYADVNWDDLWESEVGVHRLVRVSPFDKLKRRHTSFCQVAMITDKHYADLWMDEEDTLIRSYILDPYESVRDHQVIEGEESIELTDKVKEVLAGNLKLLGITIKKEK